MKKYLAMVAASALVSTSLVSGSAFAEVGVTDTEIVIGAHTAESGAYATYAPLPRAIAAVFDRVNEEGGINGRKIKFIREDTQWNYQKTAIATRKLIESDKIFAMVGGQGDSHIAAYKQLAEKGVPDLFFIDGSSSYDPLPKGAFSFQQENTTDGRVYGQYVVDNFKGKRACFISGKALAEDVPSTAISVIKAANEKLPEAQKIKIGTIETVERNAPQADVEVGKLKSDKCDVVVETLMLPLAVNVVNYASSQNFKPTWIVYWWSVHAKFIDLLNDHTAQVVSAVNMARDAQAGVPGWPAYVELMKKNKIPVTGMTAGGYFVGELFVEALKRAGKNLTRESIVKAVESMHDYNCGMCLAPVSYSPTNHWAFTSAKPIKLQDDHWVMMK